MTVERTRDTPNIRERTQKTTTSPKPAFNNREVKQRL